MEKKFAKSFLKKLAKTFCEKIARKISEKEKQLARKNCRKIFFSCIDIEWGQGAHEN